MKDKRYAIVQDSRFGEGVLLLADTSKTHGMYWTINPKKARVFDNRIEAEQVLQCYKFNNPRLCLIDGNELIGLEEDKPEEPKKEETTNSPINTNSMFENASNLFNGMFGKVASGLCRLTMNGGIAVKCTNGYKTYNVKKKRLTNVTNFCFPTGDEWFFVLPTSHAKVGDILLINGKPKCVIGVDKDREIKVIDYENSEIRNIIPERHVFMGSSYYYGKIVSLFGNALGKGNGIKNMIKMSLLSQMMSGDKSGGMSGGMNGMGQMMAMGMMFGGGENPFADMFNFDFDFDSEAGDVDVDLFEEDDEDEDETDEAPAPKKAKKTKKEEE